MARCFCPGAGKSCALVVHLGHRPSCRFASPGLTIVFGHCLFSTVFGGSLSCIFQPVGISGGGRKKGFVLSCRIPTGVFCLGLEALDSQTRKTALWHLARFVALMVWVEKKKRVGKGRKRRRRKQQQPLKDGKQRYQSIIFTNWSQKLKENFPCGLTNVSGFIVKNGCYDWVVVFHSITNREHNTGSIHLTRELQVVVESSVVLAFGL